VFYNQQNILIFRYLLMGWVDQNLLT